VAQSGRRSEVDVERLQITLSADAAGLLDHIVKIARFGRNRNEVAARIVSDWLYENSTAVLSDHFNLSEKLKQFDTRRRIDMEDMP
jgi:hypothetical protein